MFETELLFEILYAHSVSELSISPVWLGSLFPLKDVGLDLTNGMWVEVTVQS